MVDDPVKYGLCPWGNSAKLFQDHWGHALVLCLQVVAISLAVCLTFGLFCSEKFLGYIELGAHGVDFDVQLQFSSLWLDDVDVRSVGRSAGWPSATI